VEIHFVVSNDSQGKADYRTVGRDRWVGSTRMTVFLSLNLAWYIAASARAVIEETGSPGTAIVAPMLKVAWIVFPDSGIGSAARQRIFSPMWATSSMLWRPGNTTSISSPPVRPTVSP
jgi:hypothetical protein